MQRVAYDCKGRLHDSEIFFVSLYAMTWGEMIRDARQANLDASLRRLQQAKAELMLRIEDLR